MIRTSLFLLACALATGCQKQPAPNDPDPSDSAPSDKHHHGAGADDDVTIKVTHIAGKVHMLEGRGGNIAVSIGDDGVLMVDDQFEPLAPKIRAAIADLTEGAPKFAFLVNTHHHGDHTGGNPVFGQDAHIVAHANVRARLSTPQQRRGKTIDPLPEAGWPVITFEDAVSLHFNGEEVRVIHLPTGHTDGDSIVHFTGSGVVHMGDQYFNGRFPVIDLEGGGDVEGYAANVARAIEMLPADSKLIPGHGPASTLDELRAFHTMLTDSIELVRGHIAAGKSLEQIQAAGMPAKYSGLGSGFIDSDRWLGIVHASLTR
ncbi:MBL fold metallo-hydrolase [Haliangium sp.]|uniref:MBL fold metallo-hydrolase n=1 Tax=Haliangium sp. TaxID=2663208 RepID=UPI003D09FDCA